eukprot:CAMPEP_0184678350 /NCGR_PEP_ID=MMETSP0312-20130426/1074_1 /TAXON_ID=31354 /ORGANISM="Compsopogon coeruleus, Strain SAG 36.94" /LENGTH=312 /DNA_ID=CAMNT_0027127021 /DNA_START=98 /DNA_END=1036 /DNA_ORIENTATION=+
MLYAFISQGLGRTAFDGSTSLGHAQQAKTHPWNRSVGQRRPRTARFLAVAAQQADPVNLYGPFWDYAKTMMENRFEDLANYPIPDGFCRKEAMTGRGARQQLVTTQSYAYRTSKIRQIRAAHVQGGKALQVLNFVMFPHLNYSLPFFGADLVSLPGGHLIALDMQPLFHTKEYQEQYSDPVREIFEKHRVGLPWGGDFPEEAKPFFSPCFLWTRPSDDLTVQTRVFEAFKDYLSKYIELVDAAVPETDPDELDKIRQSQLAYLSYRAEKDPARGMFTRFYGPEWTEEYIHGFLFDLERKMEEGSYAIPPVLA